MRTIRSRILAVVGPIDAAGLAVAVAMTLALVFGVLGPLNLRDRQNAARAQTAARQKQRFNGVVTEIRSLTDEVNATRARIAASSLQIRPVAAVNECVAGLIALAMECGLTIQDVKAGDGTAAQRFVVVPIRIKGSGSYGGSLLFLNRLHTRLPDIGVNGFALSGSLQDPDAVRNCEFDLAWLAAAQPTAGGRIPGPMASVQE